MKRCHRIAIAIAIATTLLTGCATAATVNLGLTLPLFRADTTNCTIVSGDTLKDLASVSVYVATTATLVDSVLVSSASVSGMQGKAYNFAVQQPTWSTRWYWAWTRDAGGHQSCERSNVLQRTVIGGPPWRITDLHAR